MKLINYVWIFIFVCFVLTSVAVYQSYENSKEIDVGVIMEKSQFGNIINKAEVGENIVCDIEQNKCYLLNKWRLNNG